MHKKMISFFIYLLMTWCVVGQNPYQATRILKAYDINSDANWRWYENVPVQLYVQSNHPPINRLMPWFDNNGTASIALNTGSNNTRDMYPSDGWVLIYRDFGTEEIEQKWPHFLLYNRQKGILRIFFIDFFEATQKTLYAIKFYHKNNSLVSSNISSNSIDKGYLDSYDPAHSQIAICRATPGQWAYADFDLSTYDPNLPENLGFAFEVNSILQGNLNLFANKLDEVNDKTPTMFEGVNSVIKKSQNGIALGKKYFSDTKGFLDEMKKHADNNEGKWFESTLRKISKSTISNSVPLIGGIAGIISGFIGNDKGANSTFTPFKITGDIKFESPIADFFIWAPGAKRSENDGRGIPLYDKPLGIIGIKKIHILETIHEDLYVNFRRSSFVVNKLDFVINPHSNLKITSLKYGIVSNDKETTYDAEKDFFLKKHNTKPIKISILATVSSTCDPGKEVILMKSYSNFTLKSNLQSYPPFYEGPVPMFYNSHIDSNYEIISETNFYIGGDRGSFVSTNSIGTIISPTSIVLGSGTNIKGGNVTISTSYKSQYNKYLESESFQCVSTPEDQTVLKSGSFFNKTDNHIGFTNTNEVCLKGSFRLYPNPLDDMLFIESNGQSYVYRVSIYNLMGSVLYQSLHNSNSQINTNFLDRGFYIVEIEKDGTIQKRQKILKH
jgi:hypothetical protein